MSIFDRIFGRGFGKAAAEAEAPEKEPVETITPSGKALPAGMERPSRESEAKKKVRKNPDVFYLHKSGKKLSVEEFATYREAIRQRNRLDLKKIREDLKMYQAPEAEPEEEPSWNVQPEEIVFAKISGGEIEAGWQVDQVEGGTVSLSRRDPAEPERKLAMTATREELQKINERGKIDFLQAENWSDLYKLIIRNGIVAGATAEYRPKKIKAMVDRVRSRKLSPRNITAANNLRQAVENILAKEPKFERPKPEVIAVEKNHPVAAEIKPAGIIAAEPKTPEVFETTPATAAVDAENSLLERAKEENELKALKLKDLAAQSAALDQELAAAAPVTDNPDNFSPEELKKMRHLDPGKMAAEYYSVPEKKIDTEAIERSVREQREANEAALQLEEVKAEQARAAEAAEKKQAAARAAEDLAFVNAAKNRAAVEAYQRRFAVTAADLKKIEEFEKLSPEQRLFVVKDLRQNVFSRFAQKAAAKQAEAVIFPAAHEVKGDFADAKIAEHLAKQPGSLDLRNVTSLSKEVLQALSGKTDEGVINLVGLKAENIREETLRGLVQLKTGFLLNDEALRRIEKMDRRNLVEDPTRNANEEKRPAVPIEEK